MPKLEQSEALTRFTRFGYLSSSITGKSRLLKVGEAIALGAILLAPSIWMLSVIPPLWRDLDAYFQLTNPPDILTIVHFGPIYCFGARIPLYIGYVIECLRTGKPFPSPGFFIHPTLNDSGVFLLLLSQHSALFCTAFYFIISSSRLFWVRLVLSAVWASNPLFYTFAHCVGSETLSMILLLLIGAVGLRIVQDSGSVGWKRWLMFGVLLWLSILTRHINAILTAVMPLTFLLLSGYQLIAMTLNKSQSAARWRRLRMRQQLQRATVAVAIGVMSIALANVSLRALCSLAHLQYHSTFGITVMTRLDFLARLPAEKRNELLDEIARHTSFAEVRKAIPLLREAFSNEPDNWDTRTAGLRKIDAEKVLPLFHEVFPQGSAGADDSIVFLKKAGSAFPGWSLFVTLNRTADAFLFPPRKVYIDAVAEDFRRSQTTTIPNVVNHLFLTTTLYFVFGAEMPGYATLLTYRNSSANQIVTIRNKNWYFHLWRSVNFAGFLCFWVANLVLLAVLAQKRKKKNFAVVVAYSVALTVVGLLLMLATCVLTPFLPRYTLPMWELTILSTTALLSQTLEWASSTKPRNFCL